MICDFDTMTARPSVSVSGAVDSVLFGIWRSFDSGTRGDELRLFRRKTRMMVIMSIIAVMLRKLISGSSARLWIALRSSRLYVAMLAAFCAGSLALGGSIWT